MKRVDGGSQKWLFFVNVINLWPLSCDIARNHVQYRTFIALPYSIITVLITHGIDKSPFQYADDVLAV